MSSSLLFQTPAVACRRRPLKSQGLHATESHRLPAPAAPQFRIQSVCCRRQVACCAGPDAAPAKTGKKAAPAAPAAPAPEAADKPAPATEAADKLDTAATPKAKAAKPAKSTKPFTNTQRFVVPEAVQEAFTAEWAAREQGMAPFKGFDGFEIKQDGEDFTCASKWASIPEWEEYNLSDVARRSHMPAGIWQLVPKKGEGFPEDFVPFVKMDTFVNAKY